MRWQIGTGAISISIRPRWISYRVRPNSTDVPARHQRDLCAAPSESRESECPRLGRPINLADFADRILPVDIPVARRCAALHVPGPRPERDAMIAATALVHGVTVVTRNTADFLSTGVPLLNSWEDPA